MEHIIALSSLLSLRSNNIKLCYVMTTNNAIYGKTNPSPQDTKNMLIKRFGSVVEILKEKEQYYRELYANGWNGVMEPVFLLE